MYSLMCLGVCVHSLMCLGGSLYGSIAYCCSEYWRLPYLDHSCIVDDIAGFMQNFIGRKLLQIGKKYNFCELLDFAVPRIPHPQILSRIVAEPQNS